jgi:hypothetical protein
MTPLKREASFAPSPQAIATVRERLQHMGLPVSESAARGLLDAVFAVEGPRLYSQLRGAFENSLEIIRDTAEAALGEAKNPPPSKARRVERSDLLSHREFDDDEPRPVFTRPRR